VEAYCMTCRTKRDMKDPQPVTLKNGRAAQESTCTTCGTRLVRMGAAKE
jgi:DNA topoisomerase I